VQPISVTNALPRAGTSQEAKRKKAVKVLSLGHKGIMEEASKCDRLEYKDEDKDKDKDKDKDEDEDEDEDEGKGEDGSEEESE